MASLAPLLMACPPRLALSLYNNTGADLAVLVVEKRVEWNAGTTLRISDQLDIKWDELEWKDDPRLRIRAPILVIEASDGVKRYWLELPGLPDEYSDSRSGAVERFLQLEPGGGLYAVKAGESFPVAPLPPQMHGLPLEPIHE